MSKSPGKGWKSACKTLLDVNDPEYAVKRKEYDDRLTFELDIINQMGFPGYFLIVADFIQWGKDNEVPVGPGPGLRCRFPGGLCHEDYRSRSHRLRPAVRTFP